MHLLAIGLILSAAMLRAGSNSESVQIGSSITIPPPVGFSRVFEREKRWSDLFLKISAQSERHAVYVLDSQIASQAEPVTTHCAYIDQFKKLSGRYVNRADFSEMRRELATAFASVEGVQNVLDSELKKNRENLQTMTVAVSHRTLDFDSSNSIGFTVRGSLKSAPTETDYQFATATVIVWVRGTLLWCYVTARPEDAENARREVRSWSESILSKNPATIIESVRNEMPFSSATAAIDWWQVLVAGFNGAIIAPAFYLIKMLMGRKAKVKSVTNSQ